MRAATVAVICIWLSACAARVPVIDVNVASPSERVAAANVRVFAVGQDPPKVEQVLARLNAYSCKHLTTDPPASRGDALEQLQLQAARAGANAVINLTFPQQQHRASARSRCAQPDRRDELLEEGEANARHGSDRFEPSLVFL